MLSKVGPNNKILPKIQSEKFVKLTDSTYARDSLTKFECEVHALTGNGNYVKPLRLA